MATRKVSRDIRPLIFLFLGFYFYFVSRGMGMSFSSAVFWLPVLIAQMALLGFGMGIFVAAVTTKYRDLFFVMGFAMQLWMFATPIVYPMSIVAAGLELAAAMLADIFAIKDYPLITNHLFGKRFHDRVSIAEQAVFIPSIPELRFVIIGRAPLL